MSTNHIKDAVEAHSNLNTYGSIVAILEGGSLYGGRYKYPPKIIALCKAAMQAELKLYDAAMAKAKP